VQEETAADTGPHPGVIWSARPVAGIGTLLCLPLGMALAGWYLTTSNATIAVRAFGQLGWGVTAIVLVRATLLIINGIAWSQLLPADKSIPTRSCVLLRFIREAINVLLPVASVGGDIVGARLLTFRTLPAGMAIASVATDLILQMIAQALFTLTGAIFLAGLIGPRFGIGLAGCSVAVAIIILAGLYRVRPNAVDNFGRRLNFLANGLPGTGIAAGLQIHKPLIAIWSDRRRVTIAAILHVVAWVIGTLEVWIALRVIGHSTGLYESLILQSFACAIRTVWFAIPGGLGVQEGGFVLVGHSLGIEPQIAVAVSLASRAPDLVLGLPGLAAWQWLEARQAFSSRCHR
jgi:glycosyltransferase 2 family protein